MGSSVWDARGSPDHPVSQPLLASHPPPSVVEGYAVGKKNFLANVLASVPMVTVACAPREVATQAASMENLSLCGRAWQQRVASQLNPPSELVVKQSEQVVKLREWNLIPLKLLLNYLNYL